MEPLEENKTKKFIRVVKEFAERITQDHVGAYAAQGAFFLLLSFYFVFSPDISGLSVFISLDFTGYGCLLPQISGLLLLRILPAGNLPDD